MAINIRQQLPVINGFVSIPDGQGFKRTSLTPQDVITLIPGSSIMRMGRGVGGFIADPMSVDITGVSRQSDQMWVVLPEYQKSDGAPEDWYEILRDAASA
jgi:hypothetical protein